MNQKQLLRKLETAQATRRIWIDEQAEPFPTCNCWCGMYMDLDYEQGFELMTQRLNSFLNAHSECLLDECRLPSGEEQAS